MPLSDAERKAKAREKYLANREQIIARAKVRYAEKREQLIAYQIEYARKRREEDPDGFYAQQRKNNLRWRDKNRNYYRRLSREGNARMKARNPEHVRELNRAATRRYYDKIKHDLRRASEKNARKELRAAIGANPPPELLAAEVERRMLLRAIREQSK